jgi:hypothetical protein
MWLASCFVAVTFLGAWYFDATQGFIATATWFGIAINQCIIILVLDKDGWVSTLEGFLLYTLQAWMLLDLFGPALVLGTWLGLTYWAMRREPTPLQLL